MMSPDFEKYRVHLEGFDMTREQQDETIRIIARFLEEQIYAAHGVHPIQQILQTQHENSSNLSRLCASFTHQPKEIGTTKRALQMSTRMRDSHGKTFQP
jgi:hypothetical protein